MRGGEEGCALRALAGPYSLSLGVRRSTQHGGAEGRDECDDEEQAQGFCGTGATG